MTWALLVCVMGLVVTVVSLVISRGKLVESKADQYVRLLLAQDMIERSRGDQKLTKAELVRQQIVCKSNIAKLNQEITKYEAILSKNPALAADLLREMGRVVPPPLPGVPQGDKGT